MNQQKDSEKDSTTKCEQKHITHMKNTQDKNLTQILESEQKELKVVWS